MSKQTENSIKVHCQLQNLRLIRGFVEDKLKDLLDESERNLLILAVDEVCANLIIHSNKCDDDATIELNLRLQKTPEGILFEILDNGSYFNYSNYKEPDVDDVVNQGRKGSIGLILVRRIMDEVEFTKEDSHNVCRLFKKLDFKSVA